MTYISFLDGGVGQEINSRSSANKSHPLWSIQVMRDEPEIVLEVHKDFLKAGARTISINSYTATPTRLNRANELHRFDEIHKTAIHLAQEAIRQCDLPRDTISIAGCLPPLAASYVAEVALDYEASLQEYHAIIEAEKDGVDLFLAETLSNITEAKAAADALSAHGLDSHLSLTLSDNCDNRLRSGEPLEQAIDELGAIGLASLSVNCSFPEAIDNAMPILGKSGIRCGGYANGFTSIEGLKPGTTVDNLSARTDLSPQGYAEHVDKWINAGATIIGGCCEITPTYIAYLRLHLEDKGHILQKLS